MMVDNDGIALALTVQGEGPDLLFVHGLGSSQPLWDPLISHLVVRHRCWNLDLRGHGDSDRAPGAYLPQHYASDVAAALDHIARPTIGIGHSLGGLSLVQVGAAAHPHLAGVYALDSPVFVPPQGASASASVFEAQLAMLRTFQPENRPGRDYAAQLAIAPYPAGGTIGDAMVPSQLMARAEGLSKLDPECLEVSLAGRLLGDLVAPALTMPLRMVAADPELGAAFQPTATERLRKLTPHAEIETMLGVGHQLMMIRGFDEKVRDDLDAWLTRIAS